MHPALSVIFFTVASGAGYGLFILTVMAQVFGIVKLSTGSALTATVLALVLISAGLMSSTFHLANPKNAWRAFFRFRTSWLSREGVFAVLFYPVALIYMLGIYSADNLNEVSALISWVGVFAIIIALLTVFSTGMIYASLKTIRQWNTALTPTNYILFGLSSGGIILLAIVGAFGIEYGSLTGIVIALTVLSLITKTIYYFWIAKVTGPTIKTATGFKGKVSLLDVGHTAGTFLTEEFSYFVANSKILLLKIAVFITAFLIPLGLLSSVAVGNGGYGVLILAALFSIGGLSVERWLFFAEARHVINLYHGEQHT